MKSFTTTCCMSTRAFGSVTHDGTSTLLPFANAATFASTFASTFAEGASDSRGGLPSSPVKTSTTIRVTTNAENAPTTNRNATAKFIAAQALFFVGCGVNYFRQISRLTPCSLLVSGHRVGMHPRIQLVTPYARSRQGRRGLRRS